MQENYCRFDVFERDYARYWHMTAGTINDVAVPAKINPPFDHARVFGLPDGRGGYRRVVECEDSHDNTTVYCKTDTSFNDYIVVTYGFDGALLCQIDDVVEAHLDLLRRSVVDEQTVKNERWSG